MRKGRQPVKTFQHGQDGGLLSTHDEHFASLPLLCGLSQLWISLLYLIQPHLTTSAGECTRLVTLKFRSLPMGMDFMSIQFVMSLAFSLQPLQCATHQWPIDARQIQIGASLSVLLVAQCLRRCGTQCWPKPERLDDRFPDER